MTRRPRIDPDALVAASATISGDVSVAAGACIDHGVVIASSGPPVRIGEGAVVLANSVVRSVGGSHRPAFSVEVGAGSLISPLCALAGCRIGPDCYVATAVTVLQGARIGAGSRLGARSIVHADVVLGEASRVGMGCFAVAGEVGPVITADGERARELVAKADFFGAAFGLAGDDQRQVHRRAVEILRRELAGSVGFGGGTTG